MAKGSAGRRYARAVFEFASQNGDYDKWLQDLNDIRDFLIDEKVAAIIRNPEVPFERKKAMIDAGLPDLEGLRRNFVYVLIERRGIESIDKIVAEFQRLLNERRGVAVAEVITAVPLDEAAAARVADGLAALTGKQVTLRCSVDPSIIGGIVAKIGDKLINGSVADRLARMREKLCQA
ncbi:MAG: ATP synthase F1 subunit delta [Chloroflexi bacterium]|nr:ATP synthase F1 subunit delta [Chloroflexota bacterium]